MLRSTAEALKFYLKRGYALCDYVAVCDSNYFIVKMDAKLTRQTSSLMDDSNISANDLHSRLTDVLDILRHREWIPRTIDEFPLLCKRSNAVAAVVALDHASDCRRSERLRLKRER